MQLPNMLVPSLIEAGCVASRGLDPPVITMARAASPSGDMANSQLGVIPEVGGKAGLYRKSNLGEQIG
jgi:hypothetical protein